MIIIVSPTTMNSVWGPFEIGNAYEHIVEYKIGCLRHKDIITSTFPH
jgi:hypothetical protein